MWNLHFVKRVKQGRTRTPEKGAGVRENVIKMIQYKQLSHKRIDVG